MSRYLSAPGELRYAYLYQTLFEQAILQFDILLRTIDFSRKADLFEYCSPEVRFGVKKTFVDKDESQLNKNDTVFGKVREDAMAMYQLFQDIADELEESGTYNILIQSMANIRNKQSDDYKILNYTAAKEYKVLLKNIFHLIEKLKSYKQQDYYLKNAGAAEATVIATRILCETRYLTRWVKAQKKIQNIVSKSLISKMKENKKLEEHYQNNENRVHLEITSFYEYTIQSLQEDINTWDLKRDKDEADLMRKIQEMRQRQDEIKDQIIALQQMYDKRQKQMNDYIHYKKLKQKELVEQRLREIENEEMNLLEIEKRKLMEQELLRKKYLAKQKKKRQKA